MILTLTDNLTARGRKRKNLLNQNVDWSRWSQLWTLGLLGGYPKSQPYKILVEELQNIQTAEHYSTLPLEDFENSMVMKSVWIGTEENEPMYVSQNFLDWIEEMETFDSQTRACCCCQEGGSFFRFHFCLVCQKKT